MQTKIKIGKMLNNRQSNFELLRVIAMIMIVACHICVHGVQMVLMSDFAYKNYLLGSTTNKIFLSLLYPGGTVGAALFFMITGYFLVDQEKISVKKVCLETVFYCFLSVIVYVFLQISFRLWGIGYSFSEYSIPRRIVFALSSIFNPLFGTYWFVSAYIILSFLAPSLNHYLRILNKRGYAVLLISTWFILYLIQTCTETGVSNIGRSCFYYILGACIKHNLHEVKKYNSHHLELAILFWVLYSVTSYLLDGMIDTQSVLKLRAIQLCRGGVNCLFTLLCSYCIFVFFASLSFRTSKIINMLGTATFGVYLIHESILSSWIWNGIFEVSKVQFLSPCFPILAFFDLLLLYVTCTFIDLLRIKFIEPVYLNMWNNIEKLFRNHCLQIENENA